MFDVESFISYELPEPLVWWTFKDVVLLLDVVRGAVRVDDIIK